VLPNGDLLLDVTLESKAADGKVQRLGQTKVSLTPGEPSAVIAGSTLVRLTPKLKAQ
jgi:hypothetical protein